MTRRAFQRFQALLVILFQPAMFCPYHWYARILHCLNAIIWFVLSVKVALHVHYLHILSVLVFLRVLWEMCIFEPKKIAKSRSWKFGAFETLSGPLQPIQRPLATTDCWASSGPLRRKLCWNKEYAQRPLGCTQRLLQQIQKLRDYSQRLLQHSVVTAIQETEATDQPAAARWENAAHIFYLLSSQDLPNLATFFLNYWGAI